MWFLTSWARMSKGQLAATAIFWLIATICCYAVGIGACGTGFLLLTFMFGGILIYKVQRDEQLRMVAPPVALEAPPEIKQIAMTSEKSGTLYVPPPLPER